MLCSMDRLVVIVLCVLFFFWIVSDVNRFGVWVFNIWMSGVIWLIL